MIVTGVTLSSSQLLAVLPPLRLLMQLFITSTFAMQ